MIDVDLFKDLNDVSGHVKGDEYLVLIAKVLRCALPRASDFVARYGGEEFSAILPATDGAGALIAAERVRHGIADLKLVHPTAPAGVITVSIGVSTYDGTVKLSPADLTVASDRALYIAKRRGRNRCAFQPLDFDLVSRHPAAAPKSRA
jgi:diguanylate cyclase (GGDEF)-like protein